MCGPGSGWNIGFEGRIAFVEVYDAPVIEADAACLFSNTEVATCEQVDFTDKEAFDLAPQSSTGGCDTEFAACADDRDCAAIWVSIDKPDAQAVCADNALCAASWACAQTVDARVTLNGNAMASEFGVTLDGDGDWATVAPQASGWAYLDDASFTVSLWVTQSLCKKPGYFESMFAHSENDGDGAGWQNNTAVNMYSTCWGEEPAIQVRLRDNDDTMAEVHLPASDARGGGTTTSTWMMLSVVVSSDALRLYIDGIEFSGDYQFSGYNRYDEINTANPSPASLSQAFTSFGELNSAPIYLGKSAYSWQGYFEGSISHFSVYNSALSLVAIDCLYQVMENTAPTCGATGGGRGGFYASFQDGNVPEYSFLKGEAHMTANFGLILDGDADYLEIKTETGDRRSILDFADDGSFGLSMWISKPACNLPERWEFVLSQLEDPTKSLMDPDNGGVDVYVGCDNGWRTISTVTGDILRTRLRDRNGTMAVFDIQLDYFGGGVMQDTWVHLVMNVSQAAAAAASV
jgi:hypothetical protein